MHKIVICLTFVLYAAGVFPAQAQSSAGSGTGIKPMRIEIPARSDAETYRIMPFGTNGFVLFFKSMETVDDTLVRWYFALHDTDFRQTWIRSVPVPLGMDLHSSQRKQDTLVLLFQMGPKEKNATHSHFLLRLPVNGVQVYGERIRIPEDHELTAFLLNGSHAYLGLALKNSPASVQVLNLITKQTFLRTIPAESPSSVLSMAFDSINQRLLISLKKQFGKSTYENYLVLGVPQVGMEEHVTTDFLIGPNPSKGMVKLTFTGNDRKEIRVVNILGNTVASRVTTQQVESFDFSSLSKGVYFVQVKAEATSKVITKKLILQ